MARRMLPFAPGGAIQAGVGFQSEQFDDAVLDSAWSEFTTDELAITTEFKGSDEFYYSHVNDDATRLSDGGDCVTIPGADVTVYIKSKSGTITVYQTTELALRAR